MEITARERAAILQSLAAGVVPAIGLHHIQVGLKNEIESIAENLAAVEQGGSSVRFIIGPYGSGKTFFLQLVRSLALSRRFLTVHADITTDRRLHGTSGQARALYGELMQNMSTRGRPEGGAIVSVVERWVSDVDHGIHASGGSDDDVKKHFAQVLRPLAELVSGHDFVTVLTRYYEGYLEHKQPLQDAAVRWLRADYKARSDARNDLGVRTIITDDTIYDYLKLWAAFAKIAGYAGLLVNLDELVVLSHRLTNTVARNNNFEALLRIVNDCLQGSTSGLLFLFAGTDECLQDTRRGLYSYRALATRLAANRFASATHRDVTGPVMKLSHLRPEDCYVLLTNIRHVMAGGDPQKYLIPDAAIVEYLRQCNERMGAAYFQTPRDTVRDFVGFLRVLEQNPGTDWHTVLAPPPGQAKSSAGSSAPFPPSPVSGTAASPPAAPFSSRGTPAGSESSQDAPPPRPPTTLDELSRFRL